MMYRHFMIQAELTPSFFMDSDAEPVEFKTLTVCFEETNIRRLTYKQIDEHMKNSYHNPNMIYVNYEGYKAIVADVSQDGNAVFPDYYLGLRIEIIPDDLCRGIYVHVAERDTHLDTITKLMAERSKNGVAI
jgi:hypothetical protein